jgi:transcriptional regulator with XRE-family HTH domain
MRKATSSTRAVAQRVRELRRKRGWSAENLAQRCAEVGAPGLNRAVIANLECGRRTYVTTDELLTLAYVLDVAPVHLLVPVNLDEAVAEHHYQLTPDRLIAVRDARQWIRGRFCPPGSDSRRYFSEVPLDEWPGRRNWQQGRAGR